MKKLFQLGAVFCGILVSGYGFAQNAPQAPSAAPTQMQAKPQAQPQAQGQYADGYAQGGQGNVIEDGCCPAEHACEDQSCNECWCLYCRYKPCYYTTQRCVEEQIPCKKTCCRYCDKYYEVQRCRYVPQYYTETCCRKEPEYYEVDDCKCCKRYVCDTHCKYVPEYYWKHICGNPECTTPCPSK